MPVFIRCLYIPGGCLGCLNHEQYDYDYDAMIHVEESLSSLFGPSLDPAFSFGKCKRHTHGTRVKRERSHL